MSNDKLYSLRKESTHQSNFIKKTRETEKPPERLYDNTLYLSLMGGFTPSDIPFIPQNILFLQQTIGNQAVGRFIQVKLKSQPGDKHEKEANRAAEAVMRMPKPYIQRAPTGPFTKDSFWRNRGLEKSIQTRSTSKQPALKQIGKEKMKTGKVGKACVKSERIPDKHTGAYGLQGLVNDYFEMNIDWDKSKSNCECGCGEYRQFVKGHIKVNGHPIKKKLYDGAVLEENKYHEDADDKGRPYGHRDDKNISIDKFIDPEHKVSDRATACSYRGHDMPGIQIASSFHLDMHLTFKGQTYDRCTNAFGEAHEWETEWNDLVP